MKVIFGDNQFLAVNHASGKEEYYTQHFTDDDRVAETLRVAWDVGVREYAFTATPRMVKIVNSIASDCPFLLHPAFPYAQAINNKLADGGVIGLAREVASTASYYNVLVGGVSALFYNYRRLLRLYIDLELRGIDPRQIGSIGLLNVVTDFLLGLGRSDIIKQFCSVIRDHYKKTPVLYTMNFPMLAESIWHDDHDDTRLIFNFNEKGFRVNPSRQLVSETMSKYDDKDMYIMSIYSGLGSMAAEQFISDYPAVKGVLFGSSNKIRIQDNFNRLSAV